MAMWAVLYRGLYEQAGSDFLLVLHRLGRLPRVELHAGPGERAP